MPGAFASSARGPIAGRPALVRVHDRLPRRRDLYGHCPQRRGALRAARSPGTGARYTRANPPRALLAKFACANQSIAGRMEAAIKKLSAAGKRNLVGKSARRGAQQPARRSTIHRSVKLRK
jgi:predicted GIY-YIG superfamily endonuclease